MQAQATHKQTRTKRATDPMAIRPFKVSRVYKETEDTFTLALLPDNKSKSFDFLPGQFNMLYQFGVGEVPISISGDPLRKDKIYHTIRKVGSVTNAIGLLRPDDTIGVRGPFGSAWPVVEAETKDVIILAGGIGLAPLRPAVYHILANRKSYGRVAILYGARTPGDMLFTKELESWRSRFDMFVDVTVDQASTDWRGNIGVVPRLVQGNVQDPANTLVMMCGPEIMMRFTLNELERQGIPDEQIYLSMERNMKCGVGLCGHCQMGHRFICKDGPVYCADDMRKVLIRREM